MEIKALQVSFKSSWPVKTIPVGIKDIPSALIDLIPLPIPCSNRTYIYILCPKITLRGYIIRNDQDFCKITMFILVTTRQRCNGCKIFCSPVCLTSTLMRKDKYSNEWILLTGFFRKNKESAPIIGTSPSKGSRITLTVPWSWNRRTHTVILYRE